MPKYIVSVQSLLVQMFVKGVPEMLCMVLADVFDCNIVNNERERDRPSFV
jgi:hypothetical protein